MHCWPVLSVADERHPAGTPARVRLPWVASCSYDEHLKHLLVVFMHLQAYGLCVRPDKCAFGLEEIPFLGHLVSKDGICPLPAKVGAILRFPCPSDSCSLSKFLGLVELLSLVCA